MKKFFFIAVTAMLWMGVNVNAQTREEMQASQKRIANLRELIAKYPKPCGLSQVDAYGKSVYDAAVMAVVNSEKLDNFYYRSIGETQDGVTDVNVKKPTLDECTSLATSITLEATSAKQAGELAKGAAEQAKSEKNPMKLAKVAKMTKFSADVMPILLEETASQGKAINDMIGTLKSAKNL